MRSRALIACAAAIVAFQLACPLVIASEGSQLATGQFATQSDAAQFRQVAMKAGRSYRDFQVAYPPLALAVFRALGPDDFGAFRQRLLALDVVCQALIVLLLFKYWGRRAMWSYLALSTPMLFVVYAGFDLVAAALAVGAAALVRRRRPEAGAAGFVIGAFTKLWPVVLLPSVLARGTKRAFVAGIAAGVVGLAAWTAWGGRTAVGQVVSYGGAKGWEFESVPGSLLRLFTRDPMRFSQGSWRIGDPPHVLVTAIGALLVLLVAGIWWTAAHRPLPEGLAETAVIASVLVFGTLVSPQFLMWPLPFVAIAAASGARKLEPWAAAAALLTFVGWLVWSPYHPAALRSEIVVLCRNVALVGLLVVAVVEVRRRRATGRTASRPPAGTVAGRHDLRVVA